MNTQTDIADHLALTNLRPAVVVPDAATYGVQPKNTGRVHVMPNLTADCTIQLPSASNGLEFEFMYSGAADDAQDWIFVTALTTELFAGGVTQLDPAESAGSEVTPVYADFSNDDTFTVLTPNAGTLIRFVSDGASWFVNGFVVSDTVPTFA